MADTKAKTVNESGSGWHPGEWGHILYMQQILIGAIVHDIRTPLRYFMWTARSLQEDLERGLDTENLAERAQLLYTSAERMHGLVEDLLQYSRVQLRAAADGRFKKVNVHLAIAAKATLFHHIAYAKGIEIINRVDPTLIMETDPDCLAVIVHNILDNALKFTSGGTVVISSSRSDGAIRIEVTDTGRGMSREYIEWCNTEAAGFDTPLPGEDFRPPGLGLMLVRELLGRIKGKLVVSRAEEGGTVMMLEFSE
ncbi:sensor histidine kinase [Dinghuibacter silviterrae]|uniref:sensor histidine kinase n=1 Tax=Dinghuibacter silviterrae TaxID=1539049 RepID=UPI0010625845|nr:HAMP domain-containing sensor histidine kinase [Dinghuibacter silviterrae]